MTDTALLILDVQNELVHPRGAIGGNGFANVVAERGLLERIAAVQRAVRERGLPVVFVRLGFRSDYQDVMSRAPRVAWLKERKAVVLGTWGTEFPQEIAPLPGEMVYTKLAVNPFLNTGLLLWLLRKRIETLALCGVYTHMVVDSTARNADDAGFRVKVLEDCCASPDMELHRYEVEKILPLFGEVISSEAFIKDLRQAPEPPSHG
jgi:nicotinamidase-related amidase